MTDDIATRQHWHRGPTIQAGNGRWTLMACAPACRATGVINHHPEQGHD